MEQELKKSYWSDAAKAGGIIGVILFALYFIDGVLKLNGASGVISLLVFMTLGIFIYRFGRNRALKYGDQGFTFGQSMGYIITMMLFTGIIVGFGNFLLTNYIVPEYYDGLFEEAFQKNPLYDPDSDIMEKFYEIKRNPIVIVVSSIIGMFIYGGLIGLIASAFIKKKPDIFADTTDQDQEKEQENL